METTRNLGRAEVCAKSLERPLARRAARWQRRARAARADSPSPPPRAHIDEAWFVHDTGTGEDGRIEHRTARLLAPDRIRLTYDDILGPKTRTNFRRRLLSHASGSADAAHLLNLLADYSQPLW